MTNTVSPADRSLVDYRVLVVEDDLQLRQGTVLALREAGIECDAATDGLEAIRMTEWCRYDLIVTDLGMPKLHGHALLVDLLGRDDPPRVVVLTGNVDQKLAQHLLARGVEGIAFKPVDLTSFAARVKRTLAEKEPVCP